MIFIHQLPPENDVPEGGLLMSVYDAQFAMLSKLDILFTSQYPVWRIGGGFRGTFSKKHVFSKLLAHTLVNAQIFTNSKGVNQIVIVCR